MRLHAGIRRSVAWLAVLAVAAAAPVASVASAVEPDAVLRASSAADASAGHVIVGWDQADTSSSIRAALGRLGLGIERDLYGGHGTLVRVPSGRTAAEVAQRVSALPGVAYAEPDAPVTALWVPDDPLYTDGTQWAPRRIQAEDAWDVARGDGVTIAVVDTGVDLAHEDLADRLWFNPGEIAGNGVDDDDNGFKDDVYGWDFINNDAVPADDNGHGTHCAGIAAAATDNAVGIAGIAPGARIMAVKVLGSTGGGSSATLAEGIAYAAANGADVISVSVGGATASSAVREAVRRATEAGAVVVAAAGNDAGAILYPAAFSETLCVGATDEADLRASYSNYGAAMDLVAPGGTKLVPVTSTVPTSVAPGVAYGPKAGTSMATPHVSGVIALLVAERPHLSLEGVRFLLGQTALDLGDVGWDAYHGHGLVQARDAIDLMTADVTPPTSSATTATAPPEGVEVIIEASDVGLGVDRIDWRLDDGTGGRGDRIEVTMPGWRTLDYATVDLAGNREATRSISFEVTDTLPPETRADVRSEYYGGSATITLTATDRGIGVDRTLWSLGGGPAREGTTVRTDIVGDHVLEYRSIDLLGHEEATQTATFRVYGTADVQRIGGSDRYATAAALSASAHAAGSAPVVVVASGEGFADALAASGLAGALGGPVLLTRADTLPQATATEIGKLGATHAVIVGGTRAVSETVAGSLRAAGLSVERISGADRYATAARVAARISTVSGASPQTVLIARGDAFPDALALSPIAYQNHWPVLLTRPGDLPEATRDAVRAAAPGEVVVAGGETAVSARVATDIASLAAGGAGGTLTRLGGDDRYKTAAAIAVHAYGHGWALAPYIGVATGVAFPDALAGGAAAGASGGVVVLTPVRTLGAEARGVVAAHGRYRAPVRVFGGTSAVGTAVVTGLKQVPVL